MRGKRGGMRGRGKVDGEGEDDLKTGEQGRGIEACLGACSSPLNAFRLLLPIIAFCSRIPSVREWRETEVDYARTKIVRLRVIAREND